MSNVLEINSIESLNESMDLIDKMSVFVENAIYELETLSLLEDAAGSDPESKTADDVKRGEKWKAIKAGAGKALTFIWEQLERAINWLIDQFNIRIRAKIPMILKDDMTVNKYTIEHLPPEVDKLVKEYIYTNNLNTKGNVNAGKNRKDYAYSVIQNCIDSRINLTKGSHLRAMEIFKNLRDMKSTASKIKMEAKRFKDAKGDIKKSGDRNILDVMTKLKSLYQDIIKDLRHMISNSNKSRAGANEKSMYNSEDTYNKWKKLQTKKGVNKAVSETMKDNKKNGGDPYMNNNNESVIIPEGMSSKEFAAQLLIEAADLLAEDDLNESAGANGAYHRFVKEKHRALKNANDREDARLKHKRDQYIRAGYGDKAEGMKANRDMEENYEYELDKMENDKRHRGMDYGRAIAGKSLTGKTNREVSYDRNTYPGADANEHQYRAIRNNRKSELLHNRINKRAAMKEAVELLYDKAVLCEDAEEASAYVEKAEELQKEIDEIPEETPISMDDYPADDVTGGAGAGDEDDQEAIKDLCDGDKEVMDLLLDDEGKSVTVDADEGSSTSNESVDYLFDLDF